MWGQYQQSISKWDLFLFWPRINARSPYSQREPATTGIQAPILTDTLPLSYPSHRVHLFLSVYHLMQSTNSWWVLCQCCYALISCRHPQKKVRSPHEQQNYKNNLEWAHDFNSTISHTLWPRKVVHKTLHHCIGLVVSTSDFWLSACSLCKGEPSATIEMF